MDEKYSRDAQRDASQQLRVETEEESWNMVHNIRAANTAPSSPATAYSTDREMVFAGRTNGTVAETHLLRSTGVQNESYTEEHWESEIKSFVTTAPPKFIQVIKAYRVLNSDTLTLVVEVASDPPAIFEWFCNDRPVQQDRRRFQTRHGLNITTLTVERPEQGVYKCTARNPAGTSTSYGYMIVNTHPRYQDWSLINERSSEVVTERVSLTITSPPRFINQVPNLTLKPGAEAVIDVEVDANPPAKFTWFVNGYEFRDNSGKIQIYHPKENRCVARFPMPLSGEYRVVAENAHGQAVSSGYVEVYKDLTKTMRPPVAPGEHITRQANTLHSTRRSRAENQEMSTDQRSDSLHRTTTLNVYEVNYYQRSSSLPRGVRHLERHVEMGRSPSPRQRRKGSQEIEEETLEVTTTTIIADNAVPPPPPFKKQKKTEASRYLPQAPVFVNSLPDEIVVNSNEKLVLTVDVAALPQADIKWNVNGFELKPSKNVTVLNEQNRSTLVIQPPVKQGKYNVTAINDQGRTTLNTKVRTIITETVENIEHTISIGSREPSHPPEFVENAITVTTVIDQEQEDYGSVHSSEQSADTVLLRSELDRGQVTMEPSRSLDATPQPRTSEPTPIPQEVPKDIEETEVCTSYVRTIQTTKVNENMPKKPTLIAEPVQHIHVESGDMLVLESRVESNPPSTFKWYVNNFEVKAGQFVQIDNEENYSKAVFQKPATGQYKVVATNELGSVTTVTRVTTETIVEEVEERTTITTTKTSKDGGVMFRMVRKGSVEPKKGLPKPPTIVERLPPVVRVPEDEPLELVTKADAIPEAEFTWLINNFEVKKSSNVTIERIDENTSKAVFKTPTSGKYEAVARNNLGKDSTSSKVVVEYKERPSEKQPDIINIPIIIQHLPKNITRINETEELKMTVTATGIPPLSYKWFINEEEVINTIQTTIIVATNSSSLILRKPIPSESTVRVVVSNLNGNAESSTVVSYAIQQVVQKTTTTETTSSTFEMTNRGPTFVKSLEPLQVQEGESLTTGVGIDKESENCVFTWTLNNYDLQYTDAAIVDSTPHESLVTILEAEPTMTGDLTVTASNNYGSATSSAPLTVTLKPKLIKPQEPNERPPKIIEPLHSTAFLDGQPMALRCKIDALPSAMIVWSKDDLNVEEWVINKDVTTQVLPGGVCELLNPECYPEDGGLYKCTATNAYGTAETSAYISVEGLSYNKDTEEASVTESASQMPSHLSERVILPPKFVDTVVIDTEELINMRMIRLLCRVQSSAPIRITWMREHNELRKDTEKYEMHSFSDGVQILVIHSATVEDNGVYTCVAESEHGLANTSAELVVPITVITQETTEAAVPEESPMLVTVKEHYEAPPPAEQNLEYAQKSYVDSTVFEEKKRPEQYYEVTEIKKKEEEYKLLIKVADSVASALVANIFFDAVNEAVQFIVEELNEEAKADKSITTVGPPRFECTKDEYTVKKGKDIQLNTKVYGNPTPFVDWYHGEERMTVSSTVSMSYEKNQLSLTLKEIEPARAGTYYCHATNVHGTAVLSLRVHVVYELPSETPKEIVVSKIQHVEEGQMVTTNVNVTHKEEHSEHKVTVVNPDQSDAVIDAQAPEEIIQKSFIKIETEEDEHKEPTESQVTMNVSVSRPSSFVEHDVTINQPENEALAVLREKETILHTEEVMQTKEIQLTTQRPESGEQSTTQARSSVLLDRPTEKESHVTTIPYSQKVHILEEHLMAASSVSLEPEAGVNDLMNTVLALKDQHKAHEIANVEVRRPAATFDHVVTVLETESIALGIHINAPESTSHTFIDLETILQRPSTSYEADTVLLRPSKRNANTEHRIVILEGVNKTFTDAMTWSIKKVKKALGTDSERNTNAYIEVAKPTETSEQITTVADVQKYIPELLNIAAAASKVKIQNVTVTLVRQGDVAHQELVIEYEGLEEDEADMNIASLVFDSFHSKQEGVFRRVPRTTSTSEKSDEEEANIVAVFVEVDANCPDQSVEIVASVSMPVSDTDADTLRRKLQKASRSFSQSESTSTIGMQMPKFFKKLSDRQAVPGEPTQMKVIVSGMPTPDILWTVDGDPIENNDDYELVYEDGVCILRINETLPEDEGEYACEAHNPAGSAVTKCYLKVLSDTLSSTHDSSGYPTSHSTAVMRFVQHAPSKTSLFDEEENEEAFLERQLSRLSLDNGDTVSLGSLERGRLVTCVSDFELFKVVNYNEDLQETNAFHKYFETSQCTVRITELVQEEYLYAEFEASPADNYSPVMRPKRKTPPPVPPRPRSALIELVRQRSQTEMMFQKTSHCFEDFDFENTIFDHDHVLVVMSVKRTTNAFIEEDISIPSAEESGLEEVFDDANDEFDETVLKAELANMFLSPYPDTPLEDIEEIPEPPPVPPRPDPKEVEQKRNQGQVEVVLQQNAHCYADLEFRREAQEFVEPYVILFVDGYCEEKVYFKTTIETDLWDSMFKDPFQQVIKEMKENDEEEKKGKLYEPRTPILPAKLMYKGQEIGVTTREKELQPEKGSEDYRNLESMVQKCVEAIFDFDSAIDLKPAKHPTSKELTKMDTSENSYESNSPIRELKLTDTGSARRSETGYTSASLSPSKDVSPVKESNPGSNPHSNPGSKPCSNPGPNPGSNPVHHKGDSIKMTQDLTQQSRNPKHEVVDKMKEIERIAKQVEVGLSQLSPSKVEISDDVRELEETILKMAEKLATEHVCSHAQAEAKEELLRTKLAELILNPKESLTDPTTELPRRELRSPIQILKEQLDDIENSLMEEIPEDQEVQLITSTSLTEAGPSRLDTPGTKTPVKMKKVPTQELLRMTPLTTNIREQLNTLESMIEEAAREDEEDTKDDKEKSPQQVETIKKKDIHELFVQINNEIGTIRKYCSKKLSKRGTDAVMSVLHKVGTHITSIVNVMHLSRLKKKKHKKSSTTTVAIPAEAVPSATRVNYALRRRDQSEAAFATVIFKSIIHSFSDASTTTSSDEVRFSYEYRINNSTDSLLSPSEIEFEKEQTMKPAEIARSRQVERQPAPVAPPRQRRTASADQERKKVAKRQDHSAPPPIAPPRRKRVSRDGTPCLEKEESLPPPLPEPTTDELQLLTQLRQQINMMSSDTKPDEDENLSECELYKSFTARPIADELNAIVVTTDKLSEMGSVRSLIFDSKEVSLADDSSKRSSRSAKARTSFKAVTQEERTEMVFNANIMTESTSTVVDSSSTTTEHAEATIDARSEQETNEIKNIPCRSDLPIQDEYKRQFREPVQRLSSPPLSNDISPKIPTSETVTYPEQPTRQSSSDSWEDVNEEKQNEPRRISPPWRTQSRSKSSSMEMVPSDSSNKIIYQESERVPNVPPHRVVSEPIFRSRNENSQISEGPIPITVTYDDDVLLAEAFGSNEIVFALDNRDSSTEAIEAVQRHFSAISADETGSVNLVCEESDYGTDTEHSGFLRGHANTFKHINPLKRTSLVRSPECENIHEECQEEILRSLPEETCAVDVVLEQSSDSAKDEQAEQYYRSTRQEGDSGSLRDIESIANYVMDESDLNSVSESCSIHVNQGPQILSTITERTEQTSSATTGDTMKRFNSEDTMHVVVEENVLSQMGASEMSADLMSPNTLRETDILSDEEATPEPDEVEEVVATFHFQRRPQKCKLGANVTPDIRIIGRATITQENTFDVFIEQEPQEFNFVVNVYDEVIDFSFLTILAEDQISERNILALNANGFDDFTETSSFEDYDEGKESLSMDVPPEKTAVTVSIVARSLHDIIYASLEEIPWGEVEMTIPYNEKDNVMVRSMDSDSRLSSVQFNVTVSESKDKDKKKKLKSQESFRSSRNSFVDDDRTESGFSLNIPSYVIKLGSTATITCELNNYMPENSDIRWVKGKQLLDKIAGKVDRISHDLLEVLVISHVGFEDSDLYSLKVNDETFPVAYLIVEDQAPEETQEVSFLTPAQTLFVMDGQPSVLSVQISDPNQQVTWFKERKQLEESPRMYFEISSDGHQRIIITNTKLADQGTYYAYLGDNYTAITLVVEERIDEREVTVVASGTESDEDELREYLVPPGSTATIACELEESDRVRELIWLKDNKKIDFANDSKIEHVINGLKHYLVIHDTEPIDSGVYSVSISGTEFKVAHLAVNDLASSATNLKRKRISNNSLH